MHKHNIDRLNIEDMLIQAEVLAGVLKIVYYIQEIEDYTKEDAAKHLIDFLNKMNYLEGIETFK